MSYEIRNYLNRRQAIGMRDEWREGCVMFAFTSFITIIC